jgi:hypothetical protein
MLTAVERPRSGSAIRQPLIHPSANFAVGKRILKSGETIRNWSMTLGPPQAREQLKAMYRRVAKVG